MLLTKPAIETEIAERRLVVKPTLSEEQIGASSIDLRLGNTFVTFNAQVARQQQTTGVPTTFDAVGYNFDNLIADYGKVEHLADGDSLVFAPWMLTLGWTKEHIRLPSTLAARVEGRSKAARVGLMVHITAPTVHVGWEGNLQLEFMNIGPAPLVLRPGVAICQLILEQVAEAAAYGGQFQGQQPPR